MAKREVSLVRIRATRAFEDVRQGDESTCPLDSTVQGWINAGHVVVVKDLEVGVEGAEGVEGA